MSQWVRHRWHLSRSTLCAIYKGINALYWPSIINDQLLTSRSVLYWPSTQLHHLVTHSWVMDLVLMLIDNHPGPAASWAEFFMDLATSLVVGRLIWTYQHPLWIQFSSRAFSSSSPSSFARQCAKTSSVKGWVKIIIKNNYLKTRQSTRREFRIHLPHKSFFVNCHYG